MLGRVEQCLRGGRHLQNLLNFHLVRVAPSPVLTRFEGLDDRMMNFSEVRRGMLVPGVVAAADVSARKAEAQVNPAIPHLEAFLAAPAARMNVSNL
jgi:hypothetical protein